jgi:predicted short-subunit dehydrogenase-like oxidoreductase (DUF2520 family)
VIFPYFRRDINLKVKNLSNNQPYPDSITIVGAGNMAWHLAHAFSKTDIKIECIINRNIDKGKELALDIGTNYSANFELSGCKSQFIIVAISDSSIVEVLEKTNPVNTIIIHTSGSIGIDIFKNKAFNYGVLYPFQSLTRKIEIDFSKVPIFIDASDEITLQSIHFLASKISGSICSLNSEQRRKLHLAGVLLNNFTNHITTLAFDYLDKNGLNKDYAIPLLEETIHKIKKIGPRESQTGPARRNNKEIMEMHLEMLKEDLRLKNLYKVISDSIIAYYSE